MCGDPVVWKPSERTPLTAVACQALFRRAAAAFGDAPDGLLEVVIGGADRARQLAEDPRLPLVSATGSTVMGKAVSPLIAARLGRALLELGGNNAMVVAPSADLDLAVRAVVFSAVGTAGQRCTSLRRLIVHESIADELIGRLERAYATVPVGDPREPGTLCGPLISEDSFRRQQEALERARSDGGSVSGGERVLTDEHPDAFYVRPAVVRMPAQTEVVRTETFAPILYALTYGDLDEAVALHNDVPQGLSSCIFTTDLREAEASWRRPAATAASPTSTSARAAPRSAERSAARRTPAAGASRARTPGAPTCAARRPRSTARASCRSPRASSSTSAEPTILS